MSSQCKSEPDVRCPEIDEKGIFTVRYNNSRKVNSAAYYYCKDQDLNILGFNFRICQEDGEWSGGDPECAEPEFQCPEIEDKGVFTVRYNNDRKVNSAAYYFCKHQDQKMQGSDVRICQEDGKWSGRDPQCVEASSGFSNEKASTTSPPTSASRPQTASREPSTGVSLDSQKQDDCCRASNYVNTFILSSHEGELTLLGTKVKKGDSVEIGCKDRNVILVWRNGLRASGPVNLTCDTCQTWGVEDIPSCVPSSAGDTWIVWRRNMKLLPGGIIEIRQNENVQIQCSVLSGYTHMHYPEWRSSPPKTVGLSYNAAGSELRTLMHIDGFKAEFTGRYECSTTDTRGYQYGPTILNLTIAKAETRCPVLNEKDDFIISYSNSRKVNSIAFYFCRKQTKEIRGTSFRTCLESGEWSSEEDPSCQDIVCQKFIWSRYMDIWYSNEQHEDSVATFQCRVPRILIGSPTSTCLGNGTWSHSLPTCQLASSSRHVCPELDRKGIFIITYSNRRNVNSVAYYYCQNISKKIHGSSTRTCQHNGEWSDSEPVCVDITCRKFGVFGSLTVEYTKENKMGSIAEFHCTPPAVLVGSFFAICRLNGTWSKPQPSCEDVRCPEIEEKGIFIVRYNDDRKIGSDASYSCKGPDQKMTGSNVRKCQEDGEWSGGDPVCEAPGCEIDSLMASLKPDVVPNLQNVTGELLPSGFELTLFCDNNMVLEGNNKVKCNQQGRWNVGNVQCILGCFVDSSNSASTLIVEPKKEFYRFGEIAVLSCPKGFELTTEVERVMCMGRTGWSDPLPDCKNMINQED